jgi:hypothetical protein
MFLIFQLGRLDVWPATDLGIRNGVTRLVGAKEPLALAELRAHGDRYRPYRSVASWYIWRSLDLAAEAAPAPRAAQRKQPAAKGAARGKVSATATEKKAAEKKAGAVGAAKKPAGAAKKPVGATKQRAAAKKPAGAKRAGKKAGARGPGEKPASGEKRAAAGKAAGRAGAVAKAGGARKPPRAKAAAKAGAKKARKASGA